LNYSKPVFPPFCGKVDRLTVEKTVENPASIFVPLVSYLPDFEASPEELCKTLKKRSKKISRLGIYLQIFKIERFNRR
jgi:hypothetical protein